MRGRPPPYPVRPPDAPITRWHGTMMLLGFLPLARPTARDAVSGLPRATASSPYVVVVPYGMASRPVQTSCWNGGDGLRQPQRLERRSGRREGDVEGGALAGEVLRQLVDDLGEDRVVAGAEGFDGRAVAVLLHVEAGQFVVG